MLFPIGDENVKGGHKPIVSYLFLGLNVLFFIYQLAGEELRTCNVGAVPSEILDGENLYTLITSMFAHGGLSHIFGNMLFLWIFADNIEAVIGNVRFAIFYILGGLAAHFGHIYFGLSGTESLGCCEMCVSATNCIVDGQFNTSNLCYGSIPTVGASGAIAAVMGAYLVMFPMSKIKTLILIFIRLDVYAWVFLGLWIGMQFFNGFIKIGESAGGGVAWWAHIGGFVFGVIAGFFFRSKRIPPQFVASNEEDYPTYL